MTGVNYYLTILNPAFRNHLITNVVQIGKSDAVLRFSQLDGLVKAVLVTPNDGGCRRRCFFVGVGVLLLLLTMVMMIFWRSSRRVAQSGSSHGRYEQRRGARRGRGRGVHHRH